MGLLTELVQLIHSTFLPIDRKNFKKHLHGKIEPTEEELVTIQNFLKKILIEQSSEKNKNISYEKQMERQIEQKKVPYLKELLVEELDFLLVNGVDIDGSLDVIYAKGGWAKGFASIRWSYSKKVYVENKAALRGILGFIIYILFSIIIYFIFDASFGIDFNIKGVTIAPLIMLPICIFLSLIFILSLNTEDARIRLKKRHGKIFSK